MDALDTVLRSVRLRSTLLSRATLAPPFSVESGGMGSPVFHAVVSGECWIRLAGESGGHRLRAGDVAVVARQQPHVIAAPLDRAPVPITSLGSSQSAGGVTLIELGNPSAATKILCGTIEMEHPAGRGFVDLLPALLPLALDPGSTADWLRATIGLLDSELDSAAGGTGPIATRLVDNIVMLAIRSVAIDGVARAGWLAAVHDEHVGKAIALIHSEPARAWTAAQLASQIGLSRTGLFERFSKLVGETPARYLTRWRVHCAADLVVNSNHSVAEVAERVGYGSEDALNRAFKRVTGSTASAYRKAARQERTDREAQS